MQINLLLLNWYLLGVEMSFGHAHKARFWYLLGVFSKFSDEHPRHFEFQATSTHVLTVTRSLARLLYEQWH